MVNGRWGRAAQLCDLPGAAPQPGHTPRRQPRKHWGSRRTRSPEAHPSSRVTAAVTQESHSSAPSPQSHRPSLSRQLGRLHRPTMDVDMSSGDNTPPKQPSGSPSAAAPDVAAASAAGSNTAASAASASAAAAAAAAHASFRRFVAHPLKCAPSANMYGACAPDNERLEPAR